MKEQTSNSKHHQIMNSGQELFWKHGVSRITVEEICEKAGVSKRTFYKNFSNKKELAGAILEQMVERNIRQLKSLVESEAPFAEKAKRMIILKFQSSEGISHEFIHDIYRNKSLGLYEYIEEQMEKSKFLFAELLRDAQRKGEIRTDVKIEFVMAYLDQMSALATNKQLMAEYNDTRDMIMESIDFMFYGLGLKT